MSPRPFVQPPTPNAGLMGKAPASPSAVYHAKLAGTPFVKVGLPGHPLVCLALAADEGRSNLVFEARLKA